LGSKPLFLTKVYYSFVLVATDTTVFKLQMESLMWFSLLVWMLLFHWLWL